MHRIFAAFQTQGKFPSSDIDQQVEMVYRTALTRPPTQEEAEIGRQLVELGSLDDLTHVVFNLSEFLYRR